MKTNVQNPVQLKDAWKFKADENGMLMRKDSSWESGIMFNFTITNYKKLKATPEHQYRGEVSLQLVLGSDGEPQVFKCTLSSLLAYKIQQDSEKFVNVTFSSYSTTPSWKANPFRLVKLKDGSYMLCDVSEGGTELYTVTMPGMEPVQKQRFVTLPREKYFRYYQAKAE